MYGSNPEIEWSERYQTPTSKNQARRTLLRFAVFCHKSPTELLELQAKGMTSKDPDDQYLVLDFLQKWIESLEGRRSSKIGRLSTIRQFFEYHHRPLPPTSKNWLRGIKSDVAAVEGKLNVDRLRAVVASLGGDPRKLSMVLTQLQSFSGPRELCLIGNTMGPTIGEQIKNGADLIEVYFPFGRKHSDKEWYSYIGRDACEALRKWFAIRGYPSKGNPLIWPCASPSKKGEKKSTEEKGELTETNLAALFSDLTVRLGFRVKVGILKGKAIRYGVSVKELRDLAASIAQTCVGRTNEENEVFLEGSIEYFMGHAVDPMHYRKMHELSRDFRKRQYRIVEPYLNVVSNPTQGVAPEVEQRVTAQEETINTLRGELASVNAMLNKSVLMSEDRVKELRELEAQVDALAKMYAMRYTIIEAAGGEEKLLREAEKTGALRIRPDGSAEPTPELTAKLKERYKRLKAYKPRKKRKSAT